MSVWISDEKLLIFASLISPSKMIRHRQDLEVRQKYSAVRRIFNSLLGVSSGDETLHLMFDILLRYFEVPLYFTVTGGKENRLLYRKDFVI